MSVLGRGDALAAFCEEDSLCGDACDGAWDDFCSSC